MTPAGGTAVAYLQDHRESRNHRYDGRLTPPELYAIPGLAAIEYGSCGWLDVPAPQCLVEHIYPHIASLKPLPKSKEHGYDTHCPCHDDKQRSLSIGIGNTSKLVQLNCFANCEPAAVREALIQLGINPKCLRRGRKTQADLIDRINAIAQSDRGHAAKLLIIMAITTTGKADLPGGAELEALARMCGVSRREAYGARAREGGS